VNISITSSVTISATLLGLVAIVYLLMAVGVRHGELVWAGTHVGRLPAEQRWWSLVYGVGLMLSGFVLLDMADSVGYELVPGDWLVAAGFVVVCLLGVATLVALLKGSRWERMFFAPITFLGAGLAYWLTFAG
jgi:hypothetical protein